MNMTRLSAIAQSLHVRTRPPDYIGPRATTVTKLRAYRSGRGVMKAFLALGAAAVLIASPVLATPIDVITIEAILLAVVSVAAAIRAALSDSYSRASARKSLPDHRDARHSIH
jgi:hypothetical protein